MRESRAHDRITQPVRALTHRVWAQLQVHHAGIVVDTLSRIAGQSREQAHRVAPSSSALACDAMCTRHCRKTSCNAYLPLTALSHGTVIHPHTQCACKDLLAKHNMAAIWWRSTYRPRILGPVHKYSSHACQYCLRSTITSKTCYPASITPACLGDISIDLKLH